VDQISDAGAVEILQPVKFKTICLRPSLSNCAMLFRNVPPSSEVSRPATSTMEIGPAFRMVAEKFKCSLGDARQ
jgi:hypothetical protein